jgi:indole-3-glycerol phosphate synthase
MRNTGTVLDKIVADKKADLAVQKQQKSFEQLEQDVAELPASEEPGFFATLKKPGLKIIAEVKKASPSAGVLREPFNLAEINKIYQEAHNVAAISVITESRHFQGSADALSFFAAHNTNHKPLLRKDFIFDPYQILETRLLGAHAYLLIASLFSEDELNELVNFGLRYSLEPLVEVHDQAELDIALQTKARCIGVNCRDLKTFKIDRNRHELLKQLDGSYVRIAESAIDNPEYLRQVSAYSDAALIGTKLMKSKDIAKALEAFK